MTTDVYRVYAFDLNTNTLITELPAQGLSFDSRLNDAGSISFSLPVSRPAVASRVKPLMAYSGVPFGVYVDRDGAIVWSGIIWTWNYARASGVIQLGGKEFLSYFAQRIIAADYSSATYPSGVTPDQLAYKALLDAQNVSLVGTGANIGVTPSINNAGWWGSTTIIPGYPIKQHTAVSNVLKDMSSISVTGKGTVDTIFRASWVAGVPVKTATVYSPRAGAIGVASGIAFDLSRVMDYTWPTDATSVGTTIHATGGSSLDSTATTSATIGGSGQLPWLDKVVSFSNVNSQTQLDAMATSLPQQYGVPIPTPTVTQPTSAYPLLGSFSVGDDARLYIAYDERFPSGLNQYWRIVQYSVKVPDEGVPTITFTFNQPPVY